MNKDLPYYVALSQAPSIGQKSESLTENFKSAREVWESPENS